MPTRGTTRPKYDRDNKINFNPRAHEGHDLRLWICILISRDFNPRAHEGHDLSDVFVIFFRQFQSTCPRGARPPRGICHPPDCNFNPRAHEGHDPKYNSAASLFSFQSTCPRGARHPKLPCSRSLIISIHVPTRGTTYRECNPITTRHFNPRAHEGHDDI